MLYRYQELKRRFEPPNEKNRWDSPLFKVFNDYNLHVDSSIATSSTPTTTHDIKTSPSSSSLLSVPTCADAAIATVSIEEEPIPVKSSWKPKSKSTINSTKTPLVDTNISTNTSTNASSVAISKGQDDSLVDETSRLTISGSAIQTASNQSFSLSFPEAYEKIAQVLKDQKDLPMPNMSTVSLPNMASPDMLYEADRVTQEIVQKINAHQKDHGEGTPIVFDKFQRSLVLHRFISPSELDRIRRQFVKAASHSSSERKDSTLGGLFIDFLSSQI